MGLVLKGLIVKPFHKKLPLNIYDKVFITLVKCVDYFEVPKVTADVNQ